MSTLFKRCFTTYSPQFMRTPSSTHQFKKSVPSLENCRIQSLSGDLSEDGLTRYELDFLETVDFTKKLLFSMKNEASKLPKATDFSVMNTKEPICFESIQNFTYDFSSPPPNNNQVKMWVQVSQLPLNSTEKHNFLLLAGEFYDPKTETVVLSPSETSGAPPQETCSLAENINHLSSILDKMIKEAKVSQNFIEFFNNKKDFKIPIFDIQQ